MCFYVFQSRQVTKGQQGMVGHLDLAPGHQLRSPVPDAVYHRVYPMVSKRGAGVRTLAALITEHPFSTEIQGVKGNLDEDTDACHNSLPAFTIEFYWP